MATTSTAGTTAFRGSILHFLDDPGEAANPAGSYEHFEDGLLVVRDGHVAEVGPARELSARLSEGVRLVDRSGALILPGFVDCHIHYPQTDVIASYGEQLLEWLERYTYPAESRFEDPAHAREATEFFLDELLRNGTTTALVLGTVHPQSVDVFFAGAEARDLRMIAGKVLMDRNCPEFLRDTADSGYAESRALIEKWHGRGRLGYAITPRFAVTSTQAQLERAGELAAEFPDVFVHTHLAENRKEVALVRDLFPWARSYLDVYARFGLVRPRSVFAHCIYLDDEDVALLGECQAMAAFCPTSNLFLGSGLFDLRRMRQAGVHVGIATDVGGGTTFSMLKTLGEGYKVAQLADQPLSAYRAFYLATLGGAQGLGLDDRIGNFAPGKEADFVVLDPATTPLAARRYERTENLAERLFMTMMLGDDRFVTETYALGKRVHPR
jgi:guanine deaminase